MVLLWLIALLGYATGQDVMPLAPDSTTIVEALPPEQYAYYSVSVPSTAQVLSARISGISSGDPILLMKKRSKPVATTKTREEIGFEFPAPDTDFWDEAGWSAALTEQEFTIPTEKLIEGKWIVAVYNWPYFVKDKFASFNLTVTLNGSKTRMDKEFYHTPRPMVGFNLTYQVRQPGMRNFYLSSPPCVEFANDIQVTWRTPLYQWTWQSWIGLYKKGECLKDNRCWLMYSKIGKSNDSYVGKFGGHEVFHWTTSNQWWSRLESQFLPLNETYEWRFFDSPYNESAYVAVAFSPSFVLRGECPDYELPEEEPLGKNGTGPCAGGGAAGDMAALLAELAKLKAENAALKKDVKEGGPKNETKDHILPNGEVAPWTAGWSGWARKTQDELDAEGGQKQSNSTKKRDGPPPFQLVYAEANPVGAPMPAYPLAASFLETEELPILAITPCQATSGVAGAGRYSYWSIYIPKVANGLSVTLTSTSGDPILMLKKTGRPTISKTTVEKEAFPVTDADMWDSKAWNYRSGNASLSVPADKLTPGYWTVGVYNWPHWKEEVAVFEVTATPLRNGSMWCTGDPVLIAAQSPPPPKPKPKPLPLPKGCDDKAFNPAGPLNASCIHAEQDVQVAWSSPTHPKAGDWAGLFECDNMTKPECAKPFQCPVTIHYLSDTIVPAKSGEMKNTTDGVVTWTWSAPGKWFQQLHARVKAVGKQKYCFRFFREGSFKVVGESPSFIFNETCPGLKPPKPMKLLYITSNQLGQVQDPPGPQPEAQQAIEATHATFAALDKPQQQQVQATQPQPAPQAQPQLAQLAEAVASKLKEIQMSAANNNVAQMPPGARPPLALF